MRRPQRSSEVRSQTAPAALPKPINRPIIGNARAFHLSLAVDGSTYRRVDEFSSPGSRFRSRGLYQRRQHHDVAADELCRSCHASVRLWRRRRQRKRQQQFDEIKHELSTAWKNSKKKNQQNKWNQQEASKSKSYNHVYLMCSLENLMKSLIFNARIGRTPHGPRTSPLTRLLKNGNYSICIILLHT